MKLTADKIDAILCEFLDVAGEIDHQAAANRLAELFESEKGAVAMPIPKEGPGSLKPRAVAVLCSLRSGPKTTAELARAIGDASAHARGTREATRDLTGSMASLGLIEARNDERSPRWYLTHDGLGWLQSGLIEARNDERSPRWYLTHDGLGWLQSNGLDACHEVRLWVRDEGKES